MTRSPEPCCAPSSTYRLQLNSELTFNRVRRLVDYLHELGAGACYVSPILKARPGSRHGYDVTDHTAINPEIGSMGDLEGLVEKLRQLGMGLVVDIVPNHMCVSDLSNWRWADVLENGPSSPQARFFDIDWNPPREGLADKILLPILGDQYGRALEDQVVCVDYASGSFVLRYYETALPIAPRTWHLILGTALEHLRHRLSESDERILELESIITALGYLPLRTETDQDRIRERQREKEIIKRRLATLSADSEEVAEAIAGAVGLINGVKGNPSSFDSLEHLLADQAYRMSYWRVAADEINYRRFFDINELAAIRTEDPGVFDETHSLIFELVRKGWITGLRVDHPDGLFDPRQYFEHLQEACARPVEDGEKVPFFVVAEKIVALREELRPNWAIQGTTGYGFLNYLNGLFVYPANRKLFRGLYERWTGHDTPFAELVYESKQLILRASMSSELNVLARRLDRICQQHRHSRDFTLESLRFALREIIACFPVYRTYTNADQNAPDEEDRRHIITAIEQAKKRNAATSASVFDAIGSILLLEDPEGLTEDQKAERRLFVMRFQQLSGPVMAKGVEDTAFYRYFPLASLNEVGGDPDAFGVPPRLFHQKNQIRLRHWPFAMLATSTHDTKRSEDVRARINVLSEIPVQWYRAVRHWSELNGNRRTDLGELQAPDRNAEYLLYQSMVGTWPFRPFSDRAGHDEYVRRIQSYMEKALKEAKVHTSWINPNVAYDRAVQDFVAAILEETTDNEFLRLFREFVAPIARAGMFNSLAQVLLKATSPGIPDFYQGAETWDLSLVDPDNRRLVDFHQLESALSAMREPAAQDKSGLVSELVRTAEDGRIKLYLTSRALTYRREHRDVFERGSYIPLEIAGGRRMHVVAFGRRLGGRVIIAAAGRFFMKLASGDAPMGEAAWGDTAAFLPRAVRCQSYRDVLTGQVSTVDQSGRPLLPMAHVFSQMPVALLEGC